MNAPSKSTQQFRKGALIGAPLIALMIWQFADLDPDKPAVTATAAVAVLMAIWWMTEAIPLAVTALLPIVLFPVLGIMDGKAVSNEYVNYIIFLFIGGFIVALALERWNLHQRIALHIMARIGGDTSKILLGFMLATAFLSMWISNTATAMMMVPIAMALVTRLENVIHDIERYATGVFLGIAYGASIGGVATLVGTPPNLIFARVYQESFQDAPEISFARWMIFALPFCCVFLVLAWRWLVFSYNSKADIQVDSNQFKEQLQALGPMSREEKWVLGVFITLALLWLFRADLNLGMLTIPGWSNIFQNSEFFNDGTVAIAMAILLFIIPAKDGAKLMDWETANKLPWSILLLFGGGFALAKGFKESELSDWFAYRMQSTAGLATILIIFLICLIITFLTELTSNSATSQIFLPLLAVLAVSIGAPPALIMAPATMACSFAFMLPVATPPNAIVFGSGRLQISEMVKAGFVMNLAGVILITLYTWFLAPYLLQ